MAVDELHPALSDRYTIERELGRGGMATVYLANDAKVGRRVAIKVLFPELAAALGGDRFHREIRIASHLTHREGAHRETAPRPPIEGPHLPIEVPI